MVERSAARYLPATAWMRGYRRADFIADALAGTITAVVLVPQAMAFGLLAGLSPAAGLYASLLPPLLYALLGTSRVLAVGPVSIAAIMVAHTLGSLPEGVNPFAAAALLALLGGAVLLVLGMLRLGWLANFLGHPVLSGFTSAAALLIIASQLPALAGVRWPPEAGWFGLLPALAQALPAVQAPTLLLGVLAASVLLLSGRPLERLLQAAGANRRGSVSLGRAGPLLVVVCSTLAVVAFSLDQSHGVAVVGAVPAGLPALSFPWPGAEAVLRLLPAAALIALVGYVESVGLARTLANRRREAIDPNQELIGLGAANLGAAFSGAMPVAGGLSRTMVNYQAGARTQGAAMVTALLVAVVVFAFTPFLTHVPRTVLAAIIIVAVARLVDLRALREAWRYDRSDAAVMLATALGVIGMGIELGLMAGIVLSLLATVWKASRPHVAELGRLPGSEHFRNVRRYRHLETWPSLLLLRVDEHLSFANSHWLEQYFAQAVAAHPGVCHLVLVANAVNGIDTTALEMLGRLALSLREAGVTLHLAEVKGPVMDRLKRSSLLASMAPGRVFLSAHEAVQALADQRREL
jgi:SulP family sulfate permease